MENPWQRLRASVVDGEAWLELARRYHGRGLDWQAGYAARQAVRCQSALGASVQALGIPGWSDAASGDGLLGRADLPDARKLAEDFSAMVRDFPEDWLSWLYLARL